MPQNVRVVPPAKPVAIAMPANGVLRAVHAAFAHRRKKNYQNQTQIHLSITHQMPNITPVSVWPLQKKEPGVKELLIKMVIAGSMADSL